MFIASLKLSITLQIGAGSKLNGALRPETGEMLAGSECGDDDHV